MSSDACRKCGANMAPGAARCEWCGAPREEPQAEATQADGPHAEAARVDGGEAIAVRAPMPGAAAGRSAAAATAPRSAVPWAGALPGGAEAALAAGADASTLPPPAWLEPLRGPGVVRSRQIRVPRPVLALLGLLLLVPIAAIVVWLRTGPSTGEIQFNPSVWTCAPGENRYGAFRLPDLPPDATLTMSLTDSNGWDWWGGYEMTLAELEKFRFMDGRIPMAGPKDESCRVYTNGAYQMTIRDKATHEVLATGTVEIRHSP